MQRSYSEKKYMESLSHGKKKVEKRFTLKHTLYITKKGHKSAMNVSKVGKKKEIFTHERYLLQIAPSETKKSWF